VQADRLAQRAWQQAWLFGAKYVLAREAIGLHAAGTDRVLTLDGGRTLHARAVVIATGATYRRITIPSIERFVGAGVYYVVGGDTRVMAGHDAIVVGAGNSAGQAVVHLAKHARHVTMLVRGRSLSSSMSAYLEDEIRRLAHVEIRMQTELVAASGAGKLEQVTLRDRRTGAVETLDAETVFALIGALPRTEWLEGVLQRDAQGYVLAGVDVDLGRCAFPAGRVPTHFGTSMPGVFAAGDVRHGSEKRVASAVGEGAAVVRHVHDWLKAPIAAVQREAPRPIVIAPSA